MTCAACPLLHRLRRLRNRKEEAKAGFCCRRRLQPEEGLREQCSQPPERPARGRCCNTARRKDSYRTRGMATPLASGLQAKPLPQLLVRAKAQRRLRGLAPPYALLVKTSVTLFVRPVLEPESAEPARRRHEPRLPDSIPTSRLPFACREGPCPPTFRPMVIERPELRMRL